MKRILALGTTLILVLGFAYAQQLNNARTSELEALLAPYAEYLDYCQECFVAALEPMVGRDRAVVAAQVVTDARSSELEALLAPYAEYLDYCQECFIAALEPMIERTAQGSELEALLVYAEYLDYCEVCFIAALEPMVGRDRAVVAAQVVTDVRSSELEALLAPYAEYLEYCRECFVAALEPMIGRFDFVEMAGR